MSGGIYGYSTTAASNTALDGVSIAEGMNPANVNNAMRGGAQELAEYRLDTHGGLTSGGAADAQTVTTNSGITAYADGIRLHFVAGYTNTTAATLNVDGVGAKAIRKSNDQALTGGEIKAGGHYVVQYDASANSAAGAWLLINPDYNSDSVDINGGAIDNTVIGANAEVEGTFSNLKATGSISNTITTSGTFISGGTAGDGANIELYGGSHATLADQCFIDADTHTWRDQTGGSSFMTLTSTTLVPFIPIRGIDGSSSAPLYSFGSSTASGMYLDTAQVCIAVSGSVGAKLTGSAATFPGAYATTTGSAANVNVASTGLLARSTSALKYKANLKPVAHEAIDAFMNLNGFTYRSKIKTDDKSVRHYGFAADHADESGLKELVSYGPNGEVEGFAYDRSIVLLHAEVKRLRAELEALK